MSTPPPLRHYILDFENNEIVINISSGAPSSPIGSSSYPDYPKREPITTLLSNDGNTVTVTNVDNFKKDQARINELDGYKDGSPGLGLAYIQSIIRDLKIYDIDGSLKYPYELKKIEETILHAKKDELQHLSWIKLKKRSELDDKFTYEKVLWECGLKPEVFIENTLGDPPIGVRTFGGEIDALSKSNTQETFPKLNESVTINSRFMELMGFRLGTSIDEATLVQETKKIKINGKNVKIPDVYTYDIYLGVVNNQGAPSTIKIANQDVTDDKNRDVYFRGNAVKREVLLSCKNSDEKKKFILAKELGDKLQVIIYYIILKVEHTLEGSHIMSTCDMVVFTLCLILGIRCMYTGAYKEPYDPVPPNEIDPLIKKYSVLYYAPSTSILTKHERIIKIINDRRVKIYNENLDFTVSLNTLRTSQKAIYISGSYYTFDERFYLGLIDDIDVINCKLLNYMKDLFTNPNPTSIEEIEALDPKDVIKEMEHNFLVIHFIRKNKNGKLVMIQNKNYTRGYKNKDKLIIRVRAVANTDNQPLCDAFYILAIKYFKITNYTGGSPPTTTTTTTTPPPDSLDLPSGIFTEDDIDPTYFDFGDENIIDLNLALTKSFNKAFYRNIEKIIDDYDLRLSVVSDDPYHYNPYDYNPYLSSLHYTLYILFLYDRYIERSPSLVVEYCDIKKLLDTQTCFQSNSYTTNELKEYFPLPPPTVSPRVVEENNKAKEVMVREIHNAYTEDCLEETNQWLIRDRERAVNVVQMKRGVEEIINEGEVVESKFSNLPELRFEMWYGDNTSEPVDEGGLVREWVIAGRVTQERVAEAERVTEEGRLARERDMTGRMDGETAQSPLDHIQQEPWVRRLIGEGQPRQPVDDASTPSGNDLGTTDIESGPESSGDEIDQSSSESEDEWGVFSPLRGPVPVPMEEKSGTKPTGVGPGKFPQSKADRRPTVYGGGGMQSTLVAGRAKKSNRTLKKKLQKFKTENKKTRKHIQLIRLPK